MKNLPYYCFSATGISLIAQNKDTKNADKLFEQYEYVQAAKEYLSLVEKGIQILMCINSLRF
jgi:hypothetical protein